MAVSGHEAGPVPRGYCFSPRVRRSCSERAARLYPGSPGSSPAAGCERTHQARVPGEDTEAKPEIPLAVPSTLGRAGLERLSAVSLPHPKVLIPSEPLGDTPLPPQVKSWVDPTHNDPVRAVPHISTRWRPRFSLFSSQTDCQGLGGSQHS